MSLLRSIRQQLGLMSGGNESQNHFFDGSVPNQLTLAMLTLAAAGCGLIPVQVQSSKQEQTQRQSVKQDVANDLAADQQSAHQSESRQGTNSMPVIIICNTVSSPGGHCIAPNPDGPINDHINRNLKGATK